ncbi:MAG: hypothetical protein DRP64_11050 [Verrucomicrobia bacterium]|nr:MAG: hypothetical protein DRP64_11050 [Verrucomicrobiota bacterium]
MALSPKQQKFVEEFLIDRNATQAYIRAGYSKNGADRNAHNLMRNHEVKKQISELVRESSEKAGLTVKEILDFWKSTVLDETEGDGDNERAIKRSDRIKASELSAKFHGILTEKIELDSKVEVQVIGLDDIRHK